MRFGLLSLGDHLPDPATGAYAESQAERFQLWVELGAVAERAGFDSCWFGEHHFNDYIVSSPQMVLAAIASRTESIRLGTAVSLLPNQDPVRLAEDFATLDLLSGGRAEVGFGSGITPETFRLLGQDPAHAHARMREHLDLLQRLWREERVSWRGVHRPPFEGGRAEPRPYRAAGVPINIATGTSRESAERAGRDGHRLMLMTVFMHYRDFRPLADVYRESYAAAGHDPDGMCVSAVAYVHVRRDGRDAWERWQPYVANYIHFVARLAKSQGLSPTLQTVFREGPRALDARGRREADICGNASEVSEQLARASAELGGVDRILCYFDLGGLPGGAVLESVDAFREGVLPNFAETAALESRGAASRPTG